MLDYPSYVCSDCAESAGGKFSVGHVACFHTGICPCCGCIKTLTEPRDYGYPNLKVSYEYRAIEAMARELGQSSLYRDNPTEDSTRESTEGTISKVRPDEKRDCATTSSDIGDENCHGDGSRNTSTIEACAEAVYPSDGTVTASRGIRVGEFFDISVDYSWIIAQLISRCENTPREVIKILQELDREQGEQYGYDSNFNSSRNHRNDHWR